MNTFTTILQRAAHCVVQTFELAKALKGLWENVVPAADNSNAGRARNAPKPAKLAPLK